jgi:methylmalonyl-CoA mutase N-terminal domain/subunit
VGRLKAVRAGRDQARVAQLLDRLAEAASDPSANLMGPTIEAVKARASMGEIVARLRHLWGSYVERPMF